MEDGIFGKVTMNGPKIYVGTLYCGENELEECCRKIQGQRYQNFEHFVYKYLPNKDAHDTLFRDFLNRKEFDYLVKIDADTVVREEVFFENIIRLFEENLHIDLVEFVVYDFFEQVINLGVNCYRQGFSLIDKGDLFVDRITDIPKDRRMISSYLSSVHCPNSSDFQAFHFGFHAQIKKRDVSVRNTFWAYLKTLNRSRGLALCGATSVMNGTLGLANNSIFHDPETQKVCDRFTRYGTLKLFVYIVANYTRNRTLEFSQRVRRYFHRKIGISA
jgi:hypothetical protein